MARRTKHFNIRLLLLAIHQSDDGEGPNEWAVMVGFDADFVKECVKNAVKDGLLYLCDGTYCLTEKGRAACGLYVRPTIRRDHLTLVIA